MIIDVLAIDGQRSAKQTQIYSMYHQAKIKRTNLQYKTTKKYTLLSFRHTQYNLICIQRFMDMGREDEFCFKENISFINPSFN